MEWADREEKGLLGVIGAMNKTAETQVWDRQIGEVRGVLLMLRMLRALPNDIQLKLAEDPSEAV